MNRPILAALITLLCQFSLGSAQPYRIQIKESVRGTKRQCETREQMQVVQKVIGAEKKSTQKQEQSNGHYAKYYEEILEKKAGETLPAQARRYYYVASLNVDGKETALPYQKQWVLIRQDDKQYAFQTDKGKQLEGSSAALLHVEFNQSKPFDFQQLMLPKQPVQVKDTWAIDARPVAEHWARKTQVQINQKGVRGTGQLLRVYPHLGATFGEIRMRIEMPIQAIGAGRQAVRTAPGSMIVVNATLDACIDGGLATGKLDARFEISYKATIKGPKGKPAQIESTMRGSVFKTSTELAK